MAHNTRQRAQWCCYQDDRGRGGGGGAAVISPCHWQSVGGA